MRIDTQLLDNLSAKAKTSPRLRMNYDLRTTPNDHSQRMLNAMEPGTILPIHRHMESTEVVVCLRGRLREIFYGDTTHEITDVIELSACGPCFGLSIPVGQWHTIEVLEGGTVILETKDGAYEPIKEENILNL